MYDCLHDVSEAQNKLRGYQTHPFLVPTSTLTTGLSYMYMSALENTLESPKQRHAQQFSDQFAVYIMYVYVYQVYSVLENCHTNGENQAAVLTGKQLASAAVSLRHGVGGRTSADGKQGRRHTRDDAVSTQKALDLLDAKDAQAGERGILIFSRNTAQLISLLGCHQVGEQSRLRYGHDPNPEHQTLGIALSLHSFSGVRSALAVCNMHLPEQCCGIISGMM